MGAIITYQRGPWDCRAIVVGPDVKYHARLAGYWFPMSEDAAPRALRSAAARELARYWQERGIDRVQSA
jgi:hypothetical protein